MIGLARWATWAGAALMGLYASMAAAQTAEGYRVVAGAGVKIALAEGKGTLTVSARDAQRCGILLGGSVAWTRVCTSFQDGAPGAKSLPFTVERRVTPHLVEATLKIDDAYPDAPTLRLMMDATGTRILLANLSGLDWGLGMVVLGAKAGQYERTQAAILGGRPPPTTPPGPHQQTDVPAGELTALYADWNVLSRLTLGPDEGTTRRATLELAVDHLGAADQPRCTDGLGRWSVGAAMCERAAKGGPFAVSGTLGPHPEYDDVFLGPVADAAGGQYHLMVANPREGYAEVFVASMWDPFFTLEGSEAVIFNAAAAAQPRPELAGDWFLEGLPWIRLAFEARTDLGEAGTLTVTDPGPEGCADGRGGRTFASLCERGTKLAMWQADFQGAPAEGAAALWTIKMGQWEGFDLALGRAIQGAIPELTPDAVYIRFWHLAEPNDATSPPARWHRLLPAVAAPPPTEEGPSQTATVAAAWPALNGDIHTPLGTGGARAALTTDAGGLLRLTVPDFTACAEVSTACDKLRLFPGTYAIEQRAHSAAVQWGSFSFAGGSATLRAEVVGEDITVALRLPGEGAWLPLGALRP
ncbi:MAG: hypothetical protein ACU0DW_07955 [Shimia sp.]